MSPIVWDFGLKKTLFKRCCGERLLRLRQAGIPRISWEECQVCGKKYNRYDHTFRCPEQDGVTRHKL